MLAGKSYTSSKETLIRFAKFKKHYNEIEAHNKRYTAGLETYSLGVNEYTDLVNE